MSQAITKVYDAEGGLLHDCKAAGCSVSWNGVVLVDGYTYEAPDEANPDQYRTVAVAKGEQLEGAGEISDDWDTSEAGIARRKPSGG